MDETINSQLLLTKVGTLLSSLNGERISDLSIICVELETVKDINWKKTLLQSNRGINIFVKYKHFFTLLIYFKSFYGPYTI